MWRLAAGLLIFGMTGSAWAQQAASPSSKSELKPLEFFVGRWTAEGEIPGMGHFSAERTYRWALKGNFLELRNVLRVGKQEYEVHGMIGWNPEKHQLEAWGFSNDGTISTTECVPNDKDLICTGALAGTHMSGPIRSTFHQIATDRFDELAEMQKDGAWIAFLSFHFSRRVPRKEGLSRPPARPQ